MIADGTCSADLQRAIHLGVDDRMIGVAKDVHRLQALFHFIDFPFEHLAILHDAVIRFRKALPRSIENRALSFPGHEILRIDFVESKFGERMTLTEGILERSPIDRKST